MSKASRLQNALVCLAIIAGIILPGGFSSASALIDLDVISVETNAQAQGKSASSQIVDDPLKVITEEDLDTYVEFLTKSDPSVEDIRYTEKEVEIRYKQKGKFLALMPITFAATAIAQASGTVEVRSPWYSAITVDNLNLIENQAKVEVANKLRARLIGSVKAAGVVKNPKFTPQESATVIAELLKALKTTIEPATKK